MHRVRTGLLSSHCCILWDTQHVSRWLQVPQSHGVDILTVCALAQNFQGIVRAAGTQQQREHAEADGLVIQPATDLKVTSACSLTCKSLLNSQLAYQ